MLETDFATTWLIFLEFMTKIFSSLIIISAGKCYMSQLKTWWSAQDGPPINKASHFFFKNWIIFNASA